MTEPKNGTFLQALVPLAVLVTLLILNVTYFDDDASYGPNQIALLFAGACAGLLAFTNGHRWNEIHEGILKSINQAMPSILILMLIGALAGTWLISGIVPSMIYYGLEILTPKVFLFAACVVCMIVSLATGSSWSTAATVGVALMGIGKTLGFNEGLIAGAVISGAYFGDKMSPLSDTTNLAPAMAGTDLFRHIRYMTYTTIPSILIALILFLILGFTQGGEVNPTHITAVQDAIKGAFNLTPVLFVVPLLVIILILKKVPALPALLVGTLLGGIFAIIFQPDIIRQISPMPDGTPLAMNFTAIIQAMFGDTQIITGNTDVEKLLSQGGMMGMSFVILLVICAMVFGGIMEQGGFLISMVNGVGTAFKSLARRLRKSSVPSIHNFGLNFTDFIEGRTALVASTAGTCILFNATASEQYVSIVVPGKMFAQLYEKKNLPPELLSRTLEDAGTVTSVLIPWNSCGAYHRGVLGVEPAVYWPYCFFNLISPIMSVIVAATGYKIISKIRKAD